MTASTEGGRITNTRAYAGLHVGLQTEIMRDSGPRHTSLMPTLTD